MSSWWRLTAGATFRDKDDVVWRYDRAYGMQSLLFSSPTGVLNLKANDFVSRYAAGAWRYEPNAAASVFEPLPRLVRRTFSSFPESEQQIALYRLEFIQPFLEGKRPTADEVAKRGEECPNPSTKNTPSVRSTQRWLAAYKASRDVTSLLDRRPSTYQKKYEPIEIIDNAIDAFLERKTPFTREALIEDIQARIEKHNASKPNEKPLKVLSRATLYRRLEDWDIYEADKALLDRDHVENKWRRVLGAPVVRHISQRIEIDHARLDVIIVDAETGETLGRPWLTIALDYFSKMVVGFYLSLDTPSIDSVLQCLRSMVLPKEHLLALVPEIHTEWPAFGLCQALYIDNGLEFHAKTIRAAAADVGINEVVFCPRKKAWFKGSIERFFRTKNSGLIHQQPGTTRSNPTSRVGYDSKAHACLTYASLLQQLIQWIVEVYHLRPHRGIKNQTPLQRWTNQADIFQIRFPGDLEELEIALGCRLPDPKPVHHYGIEFDHQKFNSHALADLRSRLLNRLGPTAKSAKVEIRYYMSHIRYIHVLDPISERWFKVPTVEKDDDLALDRTAHRLSYKIARESEQNRNTRGRANREIRERADRAKVEHAEVLARERRPKQAAPVSKAPHKQPVASTLPDWLTRDDDDADVLVVKPLVERVAQPGD